VRLETERLLIREWREADVPLYAAIVADPVVRRFFPEIGTLADTRAAIDRAGERLLVFGYSMLAVERKADGALLGLVGLAPLGDELKAIIPDAPPAEIGWQLGQRYWGQGYAPEAARAWLDYGFREIGLPQIGAITYEGNLPSRRVMEKIGMVHDAAARFEHPAVPVGHHLRPHVLYRISPGRT